MSDRLPISPNSRRLRAHLGAHDLYYTNPHYAKLQEYERIKETDVTIKSALDLAADIASGYFAGIGHPNPEVDAWIQENLHFLEWERGQTFLDLFRQWFRTSLWAGFALAENMFVLGSDGRAWLEDVLTYQPRSIQIRPDRRGRLTEGNPSYSGQYSGFWQNTHLGPKNIPAWKVSWIAHNSEFGNYYGKSYLEPVYRWHVIEEMVGDMMVDALDRFGSPWVVVKFQNGYTTQRMVDPATGQERAMTVQEALEHQVQEVKLGGRNVMLLGYNDPTMKPEVDVITTGNNVGTTFVDVINFCDAKKLMAFMIPFGLVSYESKQDSSNIERQSELFYRGIRMKGEQAMKRFLGQTFHRLVKINFPGVVEPPTLAMRDLVRPEDRVALMQMVSGMTNLGYLNPTEEQDWQTVRDWVSATKRRMELGDRQFIEDTVVQPLVRRGQPTSPSSTSGDGKPGRPPGTAKPQDNPR